MINPFQVLRRFVRPAPPQPHHCDLCALTLAPEHPHLLDTESHRLICACQACAILFGSQQHERYRRIPDRITAPPGLRIPETLWASLAIPIGLAFIVPDDAGEATAFYPSPAGLTESRLSVEDWQQLTALSPAVADMRPLVEALLVNRLAAEPAYLITPLDECYRLAGIVRTTWRGFTGGPEARREIDACFAALARRAMTREKDIPCPS